MIPATLAIHAGCLNAPQMLAMVDGCLSYGQYLESSMTVSSSPSGLMISSGTHAIAADGHARFGMLHSKWETLAKGRRHCVLLPLRIQKSLKM
jgi:hypothetical protein